MHKFCLFCICCTLHCILDKTSQEKYGLPVQRKIPHNYIVCQILPLDGAQSTPQYLKSTLAMHILIHFLQSLGLRMSFLSTLSQCFDIIPDNILARFKRVLPMYVSLVFLTVPKYLCLAMLRHPPGLHSCEV